MDQILEEIEGTSCILDDMIITGKDDKEHLAHLKEVLKRLKEHGLRAKSPEMRVFPDEEHLMRTRSGGFVNYYHKFLRNLATTLKPLNGLLEQGKPWKWSAECEVAFASVKKLIASYMVLAHYDPERPLKLACDASPVGVGAVLSHV